MDEAHFFHPADLGRLPKGENPPGQGQLSEQGGCPNLQFTRLSQLTGMSPREKSREGGRSPLISSLKRVGTAELQQPRDCCVRRAVRLPAGLLYPWGACSLGSDLHVDPRLANCHRPS